MSTCKNHSSEQLIRDKIERTNRRMSMFSSDPRSSDIKFPVSGIDGVLRPIVSLASSALSGRGQLC